MSTETLTPVLREALARAVGFLQERQLATGEMRTYIATDPAMPGEGEFDSSPFATAIVLYSLGLVEDPRVPALRARAVRFLWEERQEPGLWRYWTARSGKKIAADVDDTSLISFVLRSAAPELGEPRNRALLLANRDRRGLFYTWFREVGDKNDVDAVVNANALLFLGEDAQTRPVVEYLNEVLERGEERISTWYYLDELALHHALSRALFHGVEGLRPSAAPIRERVLAAQRPDGSFGNEISTALALSTLAHLGGAPAERLRAGIESLLAAQGEEGGWRRLSFYCGPEPPAPYTYWFGSEELTTGLCLEALAHHARL